MTREWQLTRHDHLVLPDAVYYQAIWAVRDLARMEHRLDELEREIEDGQVGSPDFSTMVSDNRKDYGSVRPVEDLAVQAAQLQHRVEAIKGALGEVPEAYRDPIMNSIVLKTNNVKAPNKMWRIWKQRFLFDAATRLELV